jgi:hypothetical protein
VYYTTVGYATAGGARLWATNFKPFAGVNVPQEGAVAAEVSPDGAFLYVTGGTPGRYRSTVAYTTIAYRTATGRPFWISEYRGPRYFSSATALAVGRTGQDVFVTGYTGAHDGCCNFATVAYQP